MKTKAFSISALDDLEVELACIGDLVDMIQCAICENTDRKASDYADALYAVRLHLTRLIDDLSDLICLGKEAGV